MEEPTIKELPAQTVIAMGHRGSHDEIGKTYGALHAWAGAHGVKAAGPEVTVFLDPPQRFDPQSARFEVCMPVAAGVEGDADVTVKELPAVTAASVVVKGPYTEIPAHYTELLAWLDYSGWQIAGHPREVYIKHPAPDGSGDPKEFLTEIQFPVER